MKKSLFAYKHGDVQCGNWQWAVGAKANVGERPLCVATINFHGANAAGHDCEQLAIRFAESVRVPDEIGTKYACPECGDDKHLYDRADVRWNPDTGEWVIGDTEGTLDCTECDWTGHITEAEVKTDD